MIIEAFNKTKYLTIDERVYTLEKIEKRAKSSPVFDAEEKTEKKKQHIPPMTHPWKRSYFEAFVNKKNEANTNERATV